MKKIQITLLVLIIAASSYAQNRVMTRKDSSLYTTRYRSTQIVKDSLNANTKYFSTNDFYGAGVANDNLKVKGKTDSAATKAALALKANQQALQDTAANI